MRKLLLLSLVSSAILFQHCTNSTDEDPSPVVITVENFTATIDENPAAGSVIGTLVATVSEGMLTFSIASQSSENALAISDDGELSVNQADAFDFEVNQVLTASVTVSSEDVSETANVTVNLNDVAEGNDGLVVNNFTTNFEENPANGASIGVVSASSTQGAVQFTLLSQSPDGAIALDPSSGAISVANASLFVLNTNPVISATVEVTDGIDMESVAVTINLQAAKVIWTGDKILFSKSDGADPNSADNQDRITDNVWITRGNDGGPIFNVQSSANNDDGPGDTEWALGTTEEVNNLEFSSLRDALSGSRRAFRDIVGQDLVLHLITDDVYIDIKFTQWSQRRRGGFAYERSTEP